MTAFRVGDAGLWIAGTNFSDHVRDIILDLSPGNSGRSDVHNNKRAETVTEQYKRMKSLREAYERRHQPKTFADGKTVDQLIEWLETDDEPSVDAGPRGINYSDTIGAPLSIDAIKKWWASTPASPISYYKRSSTWGPDA